MMSRITDGSCSLDVARRYLALAVALLVFLPGLGCSKDGLHRNSISGAVRLDGKPLEKGSIRLTPTKDARGPLTGGEIKDGRYLLSKDIGPVNGWHRVEIHAAKGTGRMVPAPFSSGPNPKMIEEIGEAVAPRFNTESTLEIEIRPGNNTADFDVASK